MHKNNQTVSAATGGDQEHLDSGSRPSAAGKGNLTRATSILLV